MRYKQIHYRSELSLDASARPAALQLLRDDAVKQMTAAPANNASNSANVAHKSPPDSDDDDDDGE